jgi:hypothetical protein
MKPPRVIEMRSPNCLEVSLYQADFVVLSIVGVLLIFRVDRVRCQPVILELITFVITFIHFRELENFLSSPK